jgi:hypothetical protein
MTELVIKIDESKYSLITELITQLGGEIVADKKAKKQRISKIRKEEKTVSPTWLFGKWKDLDLDPVKYRDKLWPRREL